MGYGRHVDDALMGSPLVRADLSYTIFLSALEDYDGGELVIEDSQGEQSFKLEAGSMVLYPATYLHRVETVTRGHRWVAAGWIQSVCRGPIERELLFDLHRVLEAEFDQSGKSEKYDLLSKVRSNMLRLFAEV